MSDAVAVALHHLAEEGLSETLLRLVRDDLRLLGPRDDPGPREIGRGRDCLWLWRDCTIAEVRIPLVEPDPDAPF